MEDSRPEWPEYMVERACSTPPPGCNDVIVRDSTPVLFFGNPYAKVATLGINPSCSEFLDRSGTLLEGERRRLATLPWLGVRNFDEITRELGAKIIGECAGYFERNPYGWFNALDEILRDGLEVSYFNRTACHLDLAQWATNPNWGELGDSHRTELLSDGIPFLTKHLQKMNYCLVIVNGISVINQLRDSGLVDWTLVGPLEGPPKADIYMGKYGKTKFLAWSCNIQSQHGARRHIPALKELVATYAGRKEDNMTDSCKKWPKWLLEQATAPPPEGCEGLIVPDSTPVVSFGNPVRATVATVSLNPSSREFSEDRGLATLTSLSKPSEELSYGDLDFNHGAMILDGCARYFEQRPYDWFLPLDCILRAGARASYYADARPDARYLDLACHLDLSPWATSRRWSKLGESEEERRDIHKKLMDDDDVSPLLYQQLCQGHYRLVIVNGSGVKKGMDRFISNWEERTHPNVSSAVKLHECQFGNTQILAWSRNIQREPEHIPGLARFVAERYAEFHNERRTT